MVALTQPRNTPTRKGSNLGDPVAAGVVIHAGALVMLTAAAFATPGATATGLKSRGVAMFSVDNSDGGDGDQILEVERGVFRFENDEGDAIDRTHIGESSYAVDDQTVAATDGGGTRSVAGKIIDVDTSGVWVEVG